MEPGQPGEPHLNSRSELRGALQALRHQGLGKRTRSDLYAHRTLLASCTTRLKAAAASIDPSLLTELDELWRAHTGTPTGPALPPWNIVKVSARGDALSLLCYPEFDDVGHPALAASLVLYLDPAPGETKTTQQASPAALASARLTEYRGRANTPVLHRKELFVAPDYPHAKLFRALSAAEEAAGLLHRAHLVGYRLQWEQRLHAAGYRVDGHRLLRV